MKRPLSIPKLYCIAPELSVKKALKKVPGVNATTNAGFPSSRSD